MTSIARKYVMAITGLFLISFLCIHLLVNSFSLGLWWDGEELFNKGSHFMATNPMIQVMQYVLALGFIVHIALGIILTLQNKKARPHDYAFNKPSANSGVSARSMIYSGLLVMFFILLHLKDFFLRIKMPDTFGEIGKVTYTDGGVAHQIQNDSSLMDLFHDPLYVVLYVIGFIALGIHLNHGFQSAFQSMGANNDKLAPMLKKGGKIFSILIAVGFSAIALKHFITHISS